MRRIRRRMMRKMRGKRKMRRRRRRASWMIRGINKMMITIRAKTKMWGMIKEDEKNAEEEKAMSWRRPM